MAGAVRNAVEGLAENGVLEVDTARSAMQEMMQGEVSPVLTSAFLTLLTLDRCTPEVVSAMAETMRGHALSVDIPAGAPTVDIVGTGGDGKNTFNISTAASFVVAAAGARVVKHGNRAASSSSGSADVLEALGARLDVGPDVAGRILAESGFTFLFARQYHPAMKHVGPIRAELGIKTVFNILGPLTNPGKPDCMVCGVFAPQLGSLFVQVFKLLGMQRALVVHGKEVLDELSIAGPSMVWELRDGGMTEYTVSPADFGLETHPLSEVSGGTAAVNAREMAEILDGRGRAAVVDMVLMNAAAALYVTGNADTFASAADLAKRAMKDGRAAAVLKNYVAGTTQT